MTEKVEQDASYNIPQLIIDWKKDIEAQLKATSIIIDNKKYVRYENAKNCMRQCFTKGFKIARRNRNGLANYLIQEMKKNFTIEPKS